MRIVIVEDEIAIREGLKEMISANTSHTVIGTCKDGMEGIAFIKEHRPDLVITDIRMPKLTGLEMIEKVSMSGIKVHFIVVSGYRYFEYAQRALKYGVKDYLLKPIDHDKLMDAITKVIE